MTHPVDASYSWIDHVRPPNFGYADVKVLFVIRNSAPDFLLGYDQVILLASRCAILFWVFIKPVAYACNPVNKAGVIIENGCSKCGSFDSMFIKKMLNEGYHL